MLWILTNRISQKWDIEIEVFASYSKHSNQAEREYCAILDTHMTEYAGELEAKFGYIMLECKATNPNNKTIYLACDTEADFKLAYNRVCECVTQHPNYLDLRNTNVRIA